MDTRQAPAPPGHHPSVPAPERPRRWWRYPLVLALVIAGVAIDSAALVGIVALFALVAPLEKLFPRHQQPLRRAGLATDLAYAMAQPLLGAVGLAVAALVGAVSLAWLPGLALRPLVEMIPPLPRMLAGIALFDLAIYWTHRWGHEVAFLWRFHAIHHSNERMDWISGLRAHPFDGALIAPAFVFLIGAGFSGEFAGALAVIQVVTGLFLHANVRWRWRPLHRIVATPEFHHWHHSNEADAHCSNYAAFLPIWDLAFGTYFVPKDRRPIRYGVDEPIPAGLLDQLWHPFIGVDPPWPLLRHPTRGVRHLASSTRRGVGQMVVSARRPRRRRQPSPTSG